MSFKTVEKITNSLISEFPQTKEWDESPFNWIRGLPPASKGAIGRYIGSGLLQAYGFSPTTHRYELRLNGQKILARMALKWEGNIIKFQNIRDVDFNHVLCLGLYPNKAFAWLIPKNQIWLNRVVRKDRPGVTSQHKGADAWINIDPANPQSWLKVYGGTIDEMIKVAKSSL
jgi:hypothetical protein